MASDSISDGLEPLRALSSAVPKGGCRSASARTTGGNDERPEGRAASPMPIVSVGPRSGCAPPSPKTVCVKVTFVCEVDVAQAQVAHSRSERVATMANRLIINKRWQS